MGRCFKYEYRIKMLFVFGVCFLCILYFIFVHSFLPYFGIIFFLSILALGFYGNRITIKRYHDLGVSRGQTFGHILTRARFTTSCLFFTDGERGINEYDEAIKYQKLFKGKYCIDVYNDIFIFNGEKYSYERSMNKYSIVISGHVKKNIFTEYLQKNYASKEKQMYRTGPIYKVIEITEDELNRFINQSNFIVVTNSLYVKIKDFQVFIRKEDFKYTIILDKCINDITKESLHAFNFPGILFEDEKYIYYKKINKNDLLLWAKGIA